MTSTKIMAIALLLNCSLKTTAQDISTQATAFLSTLSPELKKRAYFPLNDEERFNMNFVPIARKGPTFHDFDQEQKQAALRLLRASLSEEGYSKATGIMELEKVLIILENNRLKADGTPFRDPLDYHFCIFGNPSQDVNWGLAF